MRDRAFVIEADCATVELLLERCRAVRRFTRELCKPLRTEDFVLQSMEAASPVRWHLAHTTWFFETFVLSAALPSYTPFQQEFCYLFNSYYNSVGAQFPRPRRGLLSRPTVAEIFEYRAHVDAALEDFLSSVQTARHGDLLQVVETGLQHEQQHQELILTDIKHAFSCNPLYPEYRSVPAVVDCEPEPLKWYAVPEGLHWLGASTFERWSDPFSYDNESPRHRVFAESFEIAARLSTNGEYVEFIEDGGYRRPELWLSAGWNHVCENGWQAPLYWVKENDSWSSFTLSGLRPLNLAEPVCHLSYFEADAFARWAGARLPSESEWETVSAPQPLRGNFAEDGMLHPQPWAGGGACRASAGESSTLESGDNDPQQLFGDVWEWTSSSYSPYPGYRAPEGALGEYNGKFMCNQYVLRGGSCATSRTHIRPTYRNFFPPEARWQFTGIRLAR